jgi:hypothetical protein
VAPVKLVNLARRIIERHIGFCVTKPSSFAHTLA